MPEPKRERLSWKELLVMFACGFPLLLIFDHLHKPGNGRTALYCMAAVAFVTRFRWELSDRWWFWPVILAVSALNLLLAWYVSLGTKWFPARGMLPFVLADAWLISALLSLCDYHSDTPPGAYPPESQSTPHRS